MAQSDVRQYEARSEATGTLGRVLCSARNHHLIVDGPAWNGCPGEEVTPGELFLSGVASCGVELLQVIAREQDLPLQSVKVAISALLDRGKPVRPGVTLFNSLRLEFHLRGVTEPQGVQLIESFKER